MQKLLKHGEITVIADKFNTQIDIHLIGRLHARDQTSSKCAFEKSG